MSIEALPSEGSAVSPRGLGSRGRTWLAVAVGLVLLYTLFGFFVVPRIIRSQILSRSRDSLHREARVDDVRFNPFTLTATVGGLRVLDRDQIDLIRLERLTVNFELSGLFRRAWRFSEIRIERPIVSARILRDGSPSVADLIDSNPDAAASKEPFRLPRLIVDRLRVNDGVVQFSDASRQPTYESRFTPLNLDISDLITIPQEGGQHAITIGVGNGAQLKWTGHQTVEPLRFSGRFDITGLELHPLWDYFAQMQPVDVRQGRIDLTLPYNVTRGSSSLEMRLDGASARIAGLLVRPKDGTADWLSLPEVQVSGVNAAWPAATAEVTSVGVVSPKVLARLASDGSWNWQHAYTPLPASSSPAKPWTYKIGRVDVQGGTVHLEAEGTPQPAVVDVADVALHATDITSNLAAPIPFTSRARVQEKGTLEASGTVAPSPLAFNVDFAAAALELPALQPYLTLPPDLRIGAGAASLKGNATMTAAQAFKVAADGALTDVELHDASGESLASWHSMTMDRFTWDDPPNRARIRTVTLDRPAAKLQIDRAGNLNLMRLTARTTATPTPAGGEGARGKLSGRVLPTLEIGTVAIRNANADFADESLPQPFGRFATKIHSANGTIKDLSTFAAAPATLDIEGRVDDTGYVKVGGTLRTADPMAASEVTVGFRSIDMQNLSPYFAEFAGYRVKSGVLDLDVKYQVVSRRLLGTHKLVAHDLAVGERVKDSKAPGLAIRLAVALLKDREGRINLDVPIEGTVDSPEFDYSKVFWGAVRTIMGNAAKAPFRALGRLFGRDEDDLELVEFDPGRSDLLPADQEMLTKLAGQLAERRELSLTIEGRFDAKADTPVLKRAKLDRLIEARRPAAATAAAAGSSALETILESLFTEQFSADALQAERQRFSAAAPAAAPAAGTAPAPSAPSTQVSPPATAPSFDAAAFYESLRNRLLDAQPVTTDDLNALASARATTIVGLLTKTTVVDAARIKTAAPAPVKRSKAGSSRIASEMTMKASGDDE